MKYYFDESIRVKNIVFSIACIVLSIILLIFIPSIKLNSLLVSIFKIILFLLLFYGVCVLLISILFPIFNRKRKMNIIKNGFHLKGKIKKFIPVNTDFKYSRFYLNPSLLCGFMSGKSKKLYAIVEYYYSDKKYECQTPILNFDSSVITDIDVDVYIYNNKIYVDGYKLK